MLRNKVNKKGHKSIILLNRTHNAWLRNYAILSCIRYHRTSIQQNCLDYNDYQWTSVSINKKGTVLISICTIYCVEDWETPVYISDVFYANWDRHQRIPIGRWMLYQTHHSNIYTLHFSSSLSQSGLTLSLLSNKPISERTEAHPISCCAIFNLSIGHDVISHISVQCVISRPYWL